MVWTRIVAVAALFFFVLPWSAGLAGEDRPMCSGEPATLVGTSAADHLKGTAKRDVIVARGGPDLIETLDGEDIVCAGRGSDQIDTGEEGDLVLGGAGNDDIDLGTSYIPCHPCWGAPNFARGGPGADVIESDGIGDLSGGDGNDRLRSGGDHSFLDGGRGSDEIDGFGSDDTLMFRAARQGVWVNLSDQTSEGQGIDDLSGIENVDGTPYEDVLVGSEDANRLVGGAGNDSIDGATGDDYLGGGPDDDILSGRDGDDLIHGHEGNDGIDGGEGVDRVLYTPASYYDTDRTAVTIDLAEGEASGRFGNDTLLEIENVTGGAGPDIISGDDGANELRGGSRYEDSGKDQLDGRGGDDLLIGESGTDEYHGGAGSDTLSYREEYGPVWVDLEAGEATTESGHETLDGIENLVGSAGNDVLLGTDGSNAIEGELGGDRIDARDGADRIWGGTTDLSRVGCSDVISWVYDPGDVIHAGSGNDWITADDELDSTPYCLTPFPGPDEVYGEGGDDALFGQGRDDLLDGGDGVDALDGGEGQDTCSAGETENACEA